MRYLLSFGVILVGLAAFAQAAPLSDCRAEQLSLSVDDDGGAFNGMSHAGFFVVLRNIGGTACVLGGLPSLSFQDAAGRLLDMARRVPPGFHPGPVVRPIALVSGGAAKAALRWVSADVYDGHHCVAAATLRVAIGSGMLTREVVIHACGPLGGPVPFEQAWLTTDPQQ